MQCTRVCGKGSITKVGSQGEGTGEQATYLRLTTGLRQTFVPPLDGRDSAVQPER
jgi:hypothetical protein